MIDGARTRLYRERIYGEYVSAFKGERSPEARAAEAERHKRFFDHLLGPLLAAGQPRDVLEAGCGPGHFLYWAASRGLSARGFDLSAEQVGAAAALGLPAEQASFQDYMPRFSESFDLVVGLDLVEHLTKDEGLDFLGHCLAALRPGGHLFLTTPNGSGLRPGPVALGDLTHETIYTPQTIALALRLSGYEEVAVREIAPPPTSLRARIRGLLWKGLRLWPMMLDLVETGSASAGVYSRVMSVTARRPEQR